MKKRYLWLILSGLMIFSLILSSCGGGSAPASTAGEKSSQEQTTGEELTVGLEADIASLDPAFDYDFSTGPVVNNIVESLLMFDDNNQVAPCLAEKWEIPDPQTYIFKIRQGVKFHDGSTMSIDDVIFSLERTRNPDTAAYVGWMLGSVNSIEKVDDSTLKITLKNPDANFLYALATSAGAVISKAYYNQHKENFGKPDGGVIATGPFKYVKWDSGSEIVIEKFSDYWNKANGGPYLDKVIFKILPEATTRIAALQTGEIQAVLMKIPGDQIPIVQKMENVNLTMAEGFAVDAAEFNVQRPPFDNVKLRQAINYAVDKVAVTKTLLGDTAMNAKATAVMPSLWTFGKDQWQAAWDKLPAYEYNLEKAKQLLAESGVKPEDVKGKQIVVDDNPVRLGQALAIQAAAKELGLELEVKKVQPQELNTLTFSAGRDYDIAVQNWSSDFPDPSGNLVPLFHSSNTGDGGANYANYKNPEVDKLLDEQNTLIDNEKRAELLIKAQAIIAEDSPWIVFDYPKLPFVLNKAYTGYKMKPVWFWEAFARNIKKIQ